MFVDTSGLMCVHNRAETEHAKAARLFKDSRRNLTHSYVLVEFVALATSRRLARKSALEFVREIDEGSLASVVFVDRSLHDAAMHLLNQRPDKNWSLCDAVSFVLMDVHRETEALTTDHHFEQAGFVRLLK